MVVVTIFAFASIFTLQPRLGEARKPGPCPAGDQRQTFSCLDDPEEFDSEPEYELPELVCSEDEAGPFSGPEDLGPGEDPPPREGGQGDDFVDANCNHPARADWKLDADQLSEWNSVETALNLKTTWKQGVGSGPRSRKKKVDGTPQRAPMDINGNFFETIEFQGARSDFVFRLGPMGVGYYREAASPFRVSSATCLKLEDCIEAPADHVTAVMPLPSMTRSARQQRHPSGKRRRPKKRCTKDKTIAGNLGCQVLEDCKLGDDDWKRKGFFAVDTYNDNCWATAKCNLLSRSAADVACIQETKLSGVDAQATIASQAQGIQWQCHASLAHGCSGGCAVAAKSGIGINPHPDQLVGDGYQHRFKLAHVSAALRGGFHCGSVYPKDSEGISEGNLLLLLEIAIALLTISGLGA